jgi:predicted aldo/keto reductase-like oxidoreductase
VVKFLEGPDLMKKEISRGRRNFCRTVAAGALAWAVPLAGKHRESGPRERQAPKGNMAYRRLGRTGLLVSEISLGSSPLPDPSLLRTLIDRGVNYIDTSHNYDNGNAERQIGRLLKDAGRDKVHVGTKFHVRPRDTKDTIVASVHGSLQRLATDYIDVLLIHGAESPSQLVDDRVLGAHEQLKKEGAYRFLGLSCHTNHEDVVRKAVSSGHYDMVQIGYNVFDIQETKDQVETYPDYLGASGIRGLLELAGSADIGVLAMKTLKVGGRRQDLGKYRTGGTSLYQAMLKWVLSDPRVSAAVTEILNHEQMEEDLGAGGSVLSEEERRTLAAYVRENGRDYCHMCGRCRNACPAGIATTDILRFLAYHESYGKTDMARRSYAALGPGETASGCRDCGACEEACPYAVAVRRRVRESAKILT